MQNILIVEDEMFHNLQILIVDNLNTLLPSVLSQNSCTLQLIYSLILV